MKNPPPDYPTAHAYRLMMLHALAKRLVAGKHSYTAEESHRVSFTTIALTSRAYLFLLTRPEMRNYIQQYGTCVALRIPKCGNCHELETAHSHGKCLFASTTYVEEAYTPGVRV